MDKAKVVEVIPKKRGRPVVPVAKGFEVLSNGLFKHQWEWLKSYGQQTGMRDGAVVQREAVQWFIDGVEASRAEVISTPEQDEDFDKLIQASNKSKASSNKSNKPNKPRSNKK